MTSDPSCECVIPLGSEASRGGTDTVPPITTSCPARAPPGPVLAAKALRPRPVHYHGWATGGVDERRSAPGRRGGAGSVLWPRAIRTPLLAAADDLELPLSSATSLHGAGKRGTCRVGLTERCRLAS
jgi:hypothetical protein